MTPKTGTLPGEVGTDERKAALDAVIERLKAGEVFPGVVKNAEKAALGWDTHATTALMTVDPDRYRELERREATALDSDWCTS